MKDEREMHVKAADKAAADASDRMKAQAEAEHRAAQEQPQNPVRAQIQIVLLMDGTFHMNAPWEDQMLARGLMDLAHEAMSEQFKRMNSRAQQQGRIQQVAVPPGMAERLRTRGA